MATLDELIAQQYSQYGYDPELGVTYQTDQFDPSSIRYAGDESGGVIPRMLVGEDLVPLVRTSGDDPTIGYAPGIVGRDDVRQTAARDEVFRSVPYASDDATFNYTANLVRRLDPSASDADVFAAAQKASQVYDPPGQYMPTLRIAQRVADTYMSDKLGRQFSMEAEIPGFSDAMGAAEKGASEKSLSWREALPILALPAAAVLGGVFAPEIAGAVGAGEGAAEVGTANVLAGLGTGADEGYQLVNVADAATGPSTAAAPGMNATQQLVTQIAQATGLPSNVVQGALTNAVTSGAKTALTGGDLGDVVSSAGTGLIAGGVGAGIGELASPYVKDVFGDLPSSVSKGITGALSGAATSGVKAGIAGGDVGTAALLGGLSGGISGSGILSGSSSSGDAAYGYPSGVRPVGDDSVGLIELADGTLAYPDGTPVNLSDSAYTGPADLVGGEEDLDRAIGTSVTDPTMGMDVGDLYVPNDVQASANNIDPTMGMEVGDLYVPNNIQTGASSMDPTEGMDFGDLYVPDPSTLVNLPTDTGGVAYGTGTAAAEGTPAAWTKTFPEIAKILQDSGIINATGGATDLGKFLGGLSAAGLGGLLGYLGKSSGGKPVGYQGGIPQYTAQRVGAVGYDPMRRPGSGGAAPSPGKLVYTPTGQMMASGGSVDNEPDSYGLPTLGLASKQLGAPKGAVAAAIKKFYSDRYREMAKQAGLASGGQPRYLGNAHDGMADTIPAQIDGKKPAALSGGEFVIPADVVSHLGNGNSTAGAKVLYDMMAKVRKARTGTPKQGKQINANKYVPA